MGHNLNEGTLRIVRGVTEMGIVSVEELGALLIVIVCISLAASYRYEHDAIAAQSTLVLLDRFYTGSLFGQEGVALMILISTILVHSLAIHRKSGNLAALGIASSNLWIGMRYYRWI